MVKNLLFCVISVFLSGISLAAGYSGNLFFTASLDGTQEVPAVATNGRGTASLYLNPTMDTLCVTMTFTGLSGPATDAHIHAGAPGVSGPAIIPFTSDISGNTVRATITGSALSTTFLRDMLSGMLYLNVHTAAYPSGEIRGQIMVETDMGFTASLDGMQEVPPVSTTAYGLGIFNLSRDMSTLTFGVVVQGLSGAITGAHLHLGLPGISGPVMIDLSPGINGNVIAGSVDPSDFLTALLTGSIYVNVHTAANPNGEIRGQLITNPAWLTFDAVMTGAKEVPPVSTSAIGVARVLLSPGFDTLKYDVVVDGLSGPITASHFHTGDVGVAGPPVLDITSSVVGNRITGMATGSAIPSGFVSDLISTGLYLNVHTTANSGGEIRGQVGRQMRESYSFVLEGSQEVPAVATGAYGSGFISAGRDDDNIYYEFVYNDLSGTFTGSHFHRAVSGTSGGIVFDISSTVTQSGNGGYASGYWTASSTVPFTADNAMQLQHDSLYINVHSSLHTGGEIRGQLNGGTVCYPPLVTGITNLPQIAFRAYPNPFSGVLNISGAVNGTRLTVYNAVGARVFQTEAERENFSIPFDDLPSGVYFLERLKPGGERGLIKLIRL